ncbi:HNH endonuclease [Tsukamurella paurometabola]|uniref:HNH endonuclease n=1 Tax=Tsukamurella paurometabola TaxID=2061 RepID=UPI000F7F124F|nr:HNH endonuclease [Tsukamurella paurometabola]
MTARPCLTCGDLISSGTYCTDCKPAETGRDKKSAHWNTSRWKNLSRRLRRQAPFCELCSSTSNLQVDHILPIVDYPELTYEVENLRVLCRTCNGRRGATFTLAEATDVLNRLLSEQARTRKVKYRKLVPVAQRAVQVGSRPPEAPSPPGGKAQRPLYTPGGYA